MAEAKGITGFSGSNGWICNFEKRNAIACVSIHGECARVAESTIQNWAEQLQIILSGFAAEDIFNVDELGLFYKLIPSKTHLKKGATCRRGKDSKIRVTLLLGANMSGTEKLSPLMIGKSEKPHCFRSFRKAKKPLPMLYEWNKKSWMTGEIFARYMKRLNEKMKSQCRTIIVFMDNCAAHPPSMSFSNIQIQFLPANTTSRLQPMDQGVIRSFKSFYRRRLVQHLIQEMEASSTAAEKVPIDLLKVMTWCNAAWNDVTQKTIANCFRKALFSESNGNDELIQDTDAEDDSLFRQLVLDNAVSFAEFVSVDDDLNIGEATEQQSEPDAGSSTEEEELEEIPEHVSKKEACQALSKLCSFNITEQFAPQSFIDSLQKYLLRHIQNTKKQTVITDVFSSTEKRLN